MSDLKIEMLPVAHAVPAMQAAQSETAAILSLVERAARDPSIDVEKLARLLDLREQMERRKAEREFDEAMGEAQGEIRPVAADAANRQTSSRYASYVALDKAIRPIYAKQGLSLSFNTAPASESMVRVLCRVAHKGGHCREYSIDMPADGKGARGGDVMTKTHATGSAISYGMRYLLKMIFNVAVGEDDDDGNKADASPVSDEQFEILRTLIDETETDIRLFCQWAKIDGLAQLPAVQFAKAKTFLERKKVQQ